MFKLIVITHTVQLEEDGEQQALTLTELWGAGSEEDKHLCAYKVNNKNITE